VTDPTAVWRRMHPGRSRLDILGSLESAGTRNRDFELRGADQWLTSKLRANLTVTESELEMDVGVVAVGDPWSSPS
jgi:hypothetical protein